MDELKGFAYGLFLAFIFISYKPESINIIGLIACIMVLFFTGWNWHKFAVQKGWVK